MDETKLTRAERLRMMGAIRRLFDSGESGFVYPLRYLWFAEGDTESSVRVLFSVPKRYHKRANKRNLLRRRTKEAYRLHKTQLEFPAAVSLDLALIYSAKEVLDYRRIEASVQRVLRQIAEQLADVKNR